MRAFLKASFKLLRTTHNAQIRPVFGINICPPFLHYCAKPELAKKATKAKRDNAVEEITIRENYKYKPYKQADLATSIEYFNSDVFRNTYKGKPVWFYYRRNYGGHFPPSVTRKSCVHLGKLVSSNPCPICRDEYLVLHHQHIELLKHFINPDSFEIYPSSKTGICRRQEKILQQEVEKARDLGYIQIWLPFYLYNYNDYYDYLPKDQLNELLKINNQFMQNNVGVISSSDITCLPPDIQEILKTNQSIPHAVEFDVHLPKIDIHPPKVGKRYKMEEDYKALLMRRRRSRSFILS
ncbi:28S ribosomal protein S18b [Schistosoma japonicum]|uniref:Small ribosomal subunit protein mS40 n=1 Tax=Schistosoma japonicum TaxID=6182 RepID=C1LG11_SCHJA|nr:28S ribosomal protein S18b [Schistosoma japonicum]CAX73639.1 28S ribosomal protein S18b, mitochondrial precursor [Schistosoma japonicum]